jgi:tight adherence protein C
LNVSAQEIITYGIVFAAILVPGLLLAKGDGTEAKATRKEKEEDARPWRFLPGLFRSVYPLLAALDRGGTGAALLADGCPRDVKLRQWIVTGGLEPMTPRLVVCAQVVYALALGVIGAVLPLGFTGAGQWVLIAGVCGFFMGWILPATTVEGTADRRRESMVRELPFAIDLIGAAMRAGSNFGDAIRFYVTQGGSGALVDEFALLMKRTQLGTSLTAALEEMARRVGSKDFTGFVAAVAHSLETGAALVDTLGIQGSEMRRVRFNIAERKAQRAPSLMILPIALFIMPAVFIIVFTPVYLKVMSSGMSGMFGK